MPETFAIETRRRIRQREFKELFTAGCCFQFALTAYHREVGTLAGIAGPEASIAHVFVITSAGLGFDYAGFRAVKDIEKTFKAEGHFPLEEKHLQQAIEKQGLPADLLAEIFRLAERIISDHLEKPFRGGGDARIE